MGRNDERFREKPHHLGSEVKQRLPRRLLRIEKRDQLGNIAIAAFGADRREQMLLVLKVDVERRLRDPRLARHIVHA
jgi:hypothetical protein